MKKLSITLALACSITSLYAMNQMDQHNYLVKHGAILAQQIQQCAQKHKKDISFIENIRKHLLDGCGGFATTTTAIIVPLEEIMSLDLTSTSPIIIPKEINAVVSEYCAIYKDSRFPPRAPDVYGNVIHYLLGIINTEQKIAQPTKKVFIVTGDYKDF